MSTQTTNLGLVKPDGPDRALVAVINENMNKIDQYAGEVNGSLGAVEDGLAIVADGNTHVAISAGQFVYVRNHTTLTEGLYVASSNIAANATLSTSNLTADSAGGLNALNSNLNTKENHYYDIKSAEWTYQFPADSTIIYNVYALDTGNNIVNVIVGEINGWRMIGTNNILGFSFDGTTRTLTIPPWTRVKISW